MAVSTDDSAGCEALAALTGDRLVPLRDVNAQLVRRFGLADFDEQVSWMISRPAVFVIDAAGVVRYRYVSRAPEDRPTTALLLLAVESLAQQTT